MIQMVADSSSLILLAKCNLLEIVTELFRLQKISFKKAHGSLEKLGKIGRYSPEIIADALVSLMEEKDDKTNNHKDR